MFIRVNKYYYIDSKLLGHFLETRDYKSVSVYILLLKNRNKGHSYVPIKNNNNKLTKGYRLLSKETGISLNTLKTYVPSLIEMGLCHFTDSGGFFMLGREKVQEKYNNWRKKTVPIRLGETYLKTASNVRAALIIAKIFRQQKVIDYKVTLNKALKAAQKGIPLNKQQHDMILRASKRKDLDLENLGKVENTVISNISIARHLSGAKDYKVQNEVSKGSYWRSNLQKEGFILSRRRYKSVWSKKVSYLQYMSMRSFFYEKYGFVTYKNGRVVKPIVSEVGVVSDNISTNISYNTIYYINIYNNKKKIVSNS